MTIHKLRMSLIHYTEKNIASTLRRTKAISMVGASSKLQRNSNRVMKFLQGNNYKVISLTNQKGVEWILSGKVHLTLRSIPNEFKMIDIFRKLDYAIEITRATVALLKLKKIDIIWLHLDIRSDTAANIA
jgi:predicted CoA-binding protein